MFEQIRTIIAEQLNVKADQIKPESSLLDFGADSLDMLGVISELEEVFGISFPDEAVNMKTVNDIVTMVEKLKKK
ncbi:MAG: acyl carrier protein [Firmicutes bacterium]|nr:acyl carrier protein [Bacillota bacterium]MCL2771378.1 acyl carrier protein [Bacillota bacterium]